MSKGNIIVTGGAGYVGSHVCKEIALAGFTPVTFDNMSTGNSWAVKWGPLEIGDILSTNRLEEVFKKYPPIAVMHFAAFALVGESMTEPAKYYKNNVVGSLNLLDACRKYDVKNFVFSSSCATYGEPKDIPISEKTQQCPVNPYGSSKLMVENILSDYDSAYGVKHVALRYFNAAGADPELDVGECREVETHLVPLVLNAILGHKPINIMGTDYPTPDGSAIRDYIHVADLAYGHLRALQHLLANNDSCQVNLGTGIGLSVKEIVSIAESITGKKVPFNLSDRRQGDPPVLVADNRNALESFLKNRTLYSPEQIIEHAWNWHLELEKTSRVVNA